MSKKARERISPEVLLNEVNRIFEEEEFYESRRTAKRFYDAKKFPTLLSRYISQSGANIRDHAKHFGMSLKTLESIVAGGSLSDSMLSRIRSALSREVTAAQKKAIYPGDWHDASAVAVADAISSVSQKLVFLKRVIESSNFLHSDDSPVDKIQVLQLIALLTAMIEALHAPFVDKKATGGFLRWLTKIAKNSTEKGVEKVVVDAMQDAVKAGRELMGMLSDGSGAPDLGNLV